MPRHLIKPVTRFSNKCGTVVDQCVTVVDQRGKQRGKRIPYFQKAHRMNAHHGESATQSRNKFPCHPEMTSSRAVTGTDNLFRELVLEFRFCRWL